MLYALICMGGLGLLFGMGLAYASKVFAVEKDPRIDAILEVLPNANCGGCGFAGCSAYAEAVARGEAEFDHCAPGGKDVAVKLAAIMGRSLAGFEKNVAYLRCQCNSRLETEYLGPKTCALAAIPAQGPYSCKFSCLTYGDCARVCQFGAITAVPGQLPRIDTDICGGCGACSRACPRHVIAVGPLARSIAVACHSQDKPVVRRKNCPTACIGCQKCVKNCPAQAISMDGTVAVVDKSRCTMCGQCLQNCPTHAIVDFLPKPAEPAPEAAAPESPQA